MYPLPAFVYGINCPCCNDAAANDPALLAYVAVVYGGAYVGNGNVAGAYEMAVAGCVAYATWYWAWFACGETA